MSLQERYRPQTFDDVLGHKVHIKAIKAQLANPDRQKIFVFVGPGGLGKTSLAYIVAKELGCKYPLLINAPKSGSKDELNDLVDQMMWAPIDGSAAKVAIIDEIHAISKQAWDTLLVPLEHGAPFAYWLLCTTELGKIPEAIKRRCVFFHLKALPYDELRAYVELIALKEDLNLSSEILDLVTEQAFGGVGQALVNLDQVKACESIAEVRELLCVSDIGDDSSIGQMAQLMIKGSKNWKAYQPLIAEIVRHQDVGVKFGLSAYLGSVIMKTSSEGTVMNLLRMLDAVEQMPPFLTPRELQGALLMLVGRIMFM